MNRKELKKIRYWDNVKKEWGKPTEKRICEDCGKATSKGKLISFSDRYNDETYDLWFCEECAKKYNKGKNL